MRHLKAVSIVLLFLCIFLTPSIHFAWEKNYICTSRYGPAPGYGRLSTQGEYSDYWNKRAEQGEFVIFQYKQGGKEYWFRRHKCRKL